MRQIENYYILIKPFKKEEHFIITMKDIKLQYTLKGLPIQGDDKSYQLVLLLKNSSINNTFRL